MTVPEVKEIRYYKGKYKVQIVKKSRMNYLVSSIDRIPLPQKITEYDCTYTVNNVISPFIFSGTLFTTVPRLLWRHPRK